MVTTRQAKTAHNQFSFKVDEPIFDKQHSTNTLYTYQLIICHSLSTESDQRMLYNTIDKNQNKIKNRNHKNKKTNSIYSKELKNISSFNSFRFFFPCRSFSKSNMRILPFSYNIKKKEKTCVGSQSSRYS